MGCCSSRNNVKVSAVSQTDIGKPTLEIEKQKTNFFLYDERKTPQLANKSMKSEDRIAVFKKDVLQEPKEEEINLYVESVEQYIKKHAKEDIYETMEAIYRAKRLPQPEPTASQLE